jgi:thioredoxin reductase (NADPH)
VLCASGVEWHRLDVAGIDDLLGAGVYYEAGPSEALACTDSGVVVVGDGNSAGQAVVRFSRYARQVTLLVRGRDLGASMSQYLIDQLSGIPNVDVRVRAQVVSLEADDRLRALVVRSGDSAEPVRLPTAALFICIGLPRTDGPAGTGLATNAAGHLVTGGDGAADRGARDLYDCGSHGRRPPLLPRRHQATDEGSAAGSQFDPHGRLPCRNR